MRHLDPVNTATPVARSLGFVVCAWAVVLVLTAGSPERRLPEVPRTPSLADTTQVDSARAGSVYITVLPRQLGGEAVLSYRPLRIPAMGWVADGSFFWRTPSDAVGPHRFEFRATKPSGSERLTLLIEVLPPDA